MHHIIGTAIGALVTYLLLIVFRASSADQYLPAVAIGAVVAMLWPWVIAFLLGRRMKNKRDESIQAEVERQMAERDKGG